MQLFYRKINNYDGVLIEKRDKNNIPFWIDWKDLIRPIKITAQNAKDVLPKEISRWISKWEEDMKTLEKENYWAREPVKLARINFIYENKIYELTPDSFENIPKKWNNTPDEALFYGNHKQMEYDLQNLGCIYTQYRDLLD